MSNRNNLPKISYTNKDFEAILQEMVAAIPSATDRWTDFNTSDVGIAILELLSMSLENLHYYLDHQANEAFLSRARERKNVINLCKLIAYRLAGHTSSTTILQFTLTAPHFARIDIPKYTRCATQDTDTQLVFATVNTAIIPVGETTVIVGARQGVPKTERFSSTGELNQRYRVSEVLVDRDSFEVIVNEVVWEQVDSFASAQSSDRQYVVEIDVEGNVEVVFGDNFFGYAPPSSITKNIVVTYLITEGSGGNIGSNSVKTVLSDLFDVIGNEVSLSVTNLQSATGGDDEETLEHAKRQAPAELSALYRAMTKSDFIALSDGFSGVGKSNCWGEQEVEPPNYNLFNWVMVVIAPENVTREQLVDDVANGLPSDQLKSDLLNYLYDRATITTRIKIIDPQYKAINFSVNVFYEPGALSNTVKAGVEEVIEEFFNFDSAEFGVELRLSNLIKLVDSVSGVRYSEVVMFKSDAEVDDINSTIVLEYYELPFLNELTVTTEKAVSLPPVPTVYPTPPAAPGPIID